MTSSRDKGNRREMQAAKLFDRAGFDVERATAGGFQSPDFFDLYDLLAVEDGEGMMMVQVKANAPRGIEQWSEDTIGHQTARGLCPVMLVCYDREGWRLIMPTDKGQYATFVDEREKSCQMGEGVVEWLEGARCA